MLAEFFNGFQPFTASRIEEKGLKFFGIFPNFIKELQYYKTCIGAVVLRYQRQRVGVRALFYTLYTQGVGISDILRARE
jgi:hypothetical protein